MFEKFKSSFEELGKGAQQMRQVAGNLRNRIAQLESERKAICALPIRAEDYASLIQQDIDRIADHMRDFIAREMSKKAGSATVNMVFQMKKRDASFGMLLGGIRSPDRDGNRAELTQGVATFLFRDEMKRAAAELVTRIHHPPFSHAQPMADSLARIEAIDGELEGLRSELADLEKLAIGINITI